MDTSAFIQGFDTNDNETKLYTTPLVLGEIRDEEHAAEAGKDKK